ncbi:MAG TPA: nucleotidyltransferase domain-containing protein [Pseudobdellovibrionaceae bacterium]|nr:nucleotidyltransferase domain-containing protein [Pseudobdellovibrionaceae bacterium]
MVNSFGLSEDVVRSISQVLSQYEQIEKAIIYGSRAKGNYKVGSDIDLTLVAPSLTLVDLFRIENEIDDLMLPYKMDLSLWHQIESKDLVDHIERVGKTFYNKPLS